MKITNAELAYIYLVKISNIDENTIEGWTREICDPHLSQSAKIALKKMIEFGGLECNGEKIYNNRKFSLYKKNDYKIIKFFEEKEKEWFGKKSIFNLKKRIIDDLVIDERILSPDVKREELDLLKRIQSTNFKRMV